MQLDDGRIRAVGKSENMVGDGGVEIEGHLIEKVFAYISTNLFFGGRGVIASMFSRLRRP